MNKVDLLSPDEKDRVTAGGALAISAKDGEGIDQVLQAIDAALVADPIVDQVFEIPQSEGGALAALDAGAIIRDRQSDGERVRVTVSGPASLLGRYREFRSDNRGTR